MNGNDVKILVANHYLKNYGGTESYTYTLIKELVRLKYDVEYFTFEKGIISDQIENDLGVSYMRKDKYDLILANHYTCVDYLFTRGFTIQTCHGVYPKLEQPSLYADAYVSISQEVQTHLALLGFNSVVIYNGIDTDRFYPKNKINPDVKVVLSLSHSEEANSLIESVCNELDLKFLKRNKYTNALWNIEDFINEADLVVGLGRSAYEAMSCGRPVVIFDKRKYMDAFADGYITNILGLSLINNCSGRYFKRVLDKQSLANEFLKYNQIDGSILRDFIVSNLEIGLITEKYLKYYYHLIRKKKQKITYNNFKAITSKDFSVKFLLLKKRLDEIRYKRGK